VKRGFAVGARVRPKYTPAPGWWKETVARLGPNGGLCDPFGLLGEPTVLPVCDVTGESPLVCGCAACRIDREAEINGWNLYWGGPNA
jgi:hypothetical protein